MIIKDYLLTFDKEKRATVSSMNHLRIEFYIEELTAELVEAQHKGWVVFDLLLSNGINKNRFVALYFDGKKFPAQSGEIIKPTKYMIKLRNDFYRQYPENITVSNIINKPQRFLFLRGRDFIQKHYPNEILKEY